MTSRPLRRLPALLVLVLALAVLPGVPAGAGPSGIVWSDVPRDHWARAAIDAVAGANAWMRDYRAAEDGTYPFRPDRLERRRLFARALVRAFAPTDMADPAIVFDDVEPATAAFRFANIAVKLGWMAADGASFRPQDPVTTREVHRALVLALGLAEESAGLDALHTVDGYAFDTPEGFGTLLLGMRLGLRYDHEDDSLDVGPDAPLSRADVAWSLYRAATASEWQLAAQAPYASIELPKLSEARRSIVEFGIGYVGYPYVWGGEWSEPTAEGYCCGAQPVGGFDCSGLIWWTMKAPTESWDNVPPRPYEGWALAQRSSADMAGTGKQLGFEEIRPGDLLFYDGDDDRRIDHVSLYLGRGWALDASGSYGGVAILRIDSAWYVDHFAWARRISR